MGNKAKALILIALCAVLTVLSFAVEKYESLADKDLIRFHVIANSDTVYDQSVKLKVRDRVLDTVQPLLKNAENAEEAGEILKENKDRITETAKEVLKEENCGYTAETTLGTSLFPTKSYGDLTLAAGKYKACRIILGDGRGKNWWCVLYPPLCFVDIRDDTAVAVVTTEKSEENRDIFAAGGSLYQVRVKSKLLELLQ
ncbi:MAG: stage II sporulation protein R [Clostridia bacterium]